jgi:hypothetical protein
LLREIGSQSGFLDLSVLSFLKSLIQKAINSDKNAIKEQEVDWMVYFLVSILTVEGVSTRNTMKIIFEQWYHHLVEKPELLHNQNVRIITKVFTRVLICIACSGETLMELNFNCKVDFFKIVSFVC